MQNLNGVVALSLDGREFGTFNGHDAAMIYNIQVVKYFPIRMSAGHHVIGVRMLANTTSNGHNFALVSLIATIACPKREHTPAECVS